MEHRAEQPHCEAVSEENRTSEEAVWETMESVEDEDEVATRTVYLPDLSAAPNFWDFSQKEQRKYEAAGAAALAGHQQSRGRDHGGHASAPPQKSEDQPAPTESPAPHLSSPRQVPETPRPILPSPEPGEESSGSPLFNLKKFQTPTQCRSRNSITYTRDMFLKKVVDPEKKEERQRKKDN